MANGIVDVNTSLTTGIGAASLWLLYSMEKFFPKTPESSQTRAELSQSSKNRGFKSLRKILVVHTENPEAGLILHMSRYLFVEEVKLSRRNFRIGIISTLHSAVCISKKL